MGREADVRRGDERGSDSAGRSRMTSMSRTRATIGIAEDLSLGQEVTDGAVVMGDRRGVTVWLSEPLPRRAGRRGVIDPGSAVQGRTDDSHPSMEGDERGHQDLSSESSHPNHGL